MIPFCDDTTMLRKLVFQGDLGIDRTYIPERPLLAMEATKFLTLYNYDQEAACSLCEKPYRPFNDCDALIWVQPGCPECMVSIMSGKQKDILLDVVNEYLIAKAHLIKFDILCSQYPWLINESFAYMRAFTDWCEMHDKVRKERDLYEVALKNQLPPAPKKTNWLSAWFGR